ncbi:uncharacterized protein KY384_008817 [Bacidia gigantensis]|uniref:uncharacterized protein n=1 Tax=Bacidia gigantensis TaxID=2732470 RepID=UPI001D04BFBF|nr:uncharacterized protein KY384_008817 [Bacidia gigantensis]KAG8526616.1 hypothetical protein KY384_008817 [Bacidia gigantensis]
METAEDFEEDERSTQSMIFYGFDARYHYPRDIMLTIRICHATGETLDKTVEFTTPLYHFMGQHSVDSTPANPTELCAHTLYGGKEKSNLGAVCTLPANAQNARRTLSINTIRKSPQYTTDYYSSALVPTLATQLFETFCFSACHCSGEDEDEQQKRKDAWTQLAGKVKQANSAENKGQ